MSFVQDKILLLKGHVQHYSWGGFDYIPHWLGIENTSHQPFAEYWMGAHPLASATVVTRNGELSLYHLINDYPEEFLSQYVRQHFNELPYLFKILDVKDMLSIQVHPTKEAAAKGFYEEEASGILLSASHRNFKDKNHKPEVMVALSEFWLLHGFLKNDNMQHVLTTIPEFGGLKDVYANGNYKGLYQHVMNMLQEEVNTLLLPLVKRELERKGAGVLTKEQPGWWVAKLFAGDTSIEETDIDRGVFSIYFLNIVKANEGEAIFQGAGIPHAYLEGQNVELMANSDNVLRGGLTPKHVDVPELLKHTVFTGIVPNIMQGNDINEHQKNYPCPVPDFGIARLQLQSGETVTSSAASLEIWVIISGSVRIDNGNSLNVQQGQAVAILPGQPFTISASAETLIYKAFVPEP